MVEHNILRERGEVLAVDALGKRGHEILAKNYRHQKVEIDIIARTGTLYYR